MNTKMMCHFLRKLDAKRIWLFDFNDLRVWFGENPATLKSALKHHISDGLIMRMIRGLYANAMPSAKPMFAREALVRYLRPHEINYESFESRLNDLGVISQIPMRLTFATSGKSGVFSTPVGVIEFTHVPLPENLCTQIVWDDLRMIWVALPRLAYVDIHRAGRNLHLVDMDELEEACHEWTS